MLQRVVLACFFLTITSFGLQAQETLTVPSSFNAAKDEALVLYSDHRITFYCGCDYTEDKAVDPQGCGYVPRNDNDRAKRIEWEHVVPAHRFGRMRKCWLEREKFDECIRPNGKKRSSRECCRRVDPEFKSMEADLQNLRPSVGELNGDRSNRPYGEIEEEIRDYGECDFEITSNLAEPAEEIRGDIARTYLYFEKTWGMILTSQEREMFELWNEEDPPDDWEIERNQRIKGIQGVGNSFVEEHVALVTPSCIPREKCCRVCMTSQACGDSCISRSATCHKPAGCACDNSKVCE